MSERVTETYLGITLVAAYYQNVYQGRAWGDKSEGEVARVTGSSLQDVLARLRSVVDSPERRQRFRKVLLQKHGEFLERKGIKSIGIPVHILEATVRRLRRVTHCYGCKQPLSNDVDLECGACRWILCGNCGACGCGYER